MLPARTIGAALAALALAAALGTSTHAAAPRFALKAGAQDVSSNWAGYAVTADGTSYTSVTATWVQPAVTCASGDDGASAAFWVGLGGDSPGAQGLEQTGTEVECTSSGPVYYAWYELIPAPSIRVGLKIRPGDTITTSVNILNGTTVEVQIKNRTRRTSFTKMLPFASPDTTSAEWIAEAPSICSAFRCTVLPLANFGTVSFTRMAAIGNGLGGTATNPTWTADQISLVPQAARGGFPGGLLQGSGSTAGATPGDLTPDGRGFDVTWQAQATGI